MKSPYYDSQMTEFYAKASAKHQFERPAEDLVKWLTMTDGEKVLDIGSGSGVVASAASRAVGSSGLVVALDSSLEMLKRQQAHARIRTVASVPGLPFTDDVFDVVTAGFVLSHVSDYPAALKQINRVSRSKGRFGMTAWTGATPRVSEVWKSAMERFVNVKVVQEEFVRIIPWDELFSESRSIADALITAGFVDVKTETREYLISIQAEEYVAMKIGSVEGTIVRNALQGEGWKQFLEHLLLSLQQEFPEGIHYTRKVHFVSGFVI